MSFIQTVTYAECHINAPYAGCRYAECRYAECRFAECLGAISFCVASSLFVITSEDKNARFKLGKLLTST